MNLDEEVELRTDFPKKRIQLWASLFPFESPKHEKFERRKSGWLMMALVGLIFILFAFAAASTIKSFSQPKKDKNEKQDQRASVWSYDSQYS